MDSAWSSGKHWLARRNSNVARILSYVGIAIGTVNLVTAIVVIIVLVPGEIRSAN